MSDQPTPETPERDSWPQLAKDAVDRIEAVEGSSWLTDRRDALLAVEDKHPPVFHIRPVIEWAWTCVEANGEKIATAGESYVDRDHAIRMAHRFADPLGARVLDDEGNDERG